MRIALILGGIAVFALVIVKVLGSTLDHSDQPFLDRGITGPLAIGAESKALQSVKVWAEPRYTHTAKDRERLFVGELAAGKAFKVINHAGDGPTLWVHIVPKDEPALGGWIRSTPEAPVKASSLK